VLFRSGQEELNNSGYEAGGSGLFASKCDAFKKGTTEPLTGLAKEQYEDACGHTRNMWIAGSAAGVAGVVAAVSFYMGFVRSDGGESNSTSSVTRKHRKQRFAVTPIVSPDGGGATIRLDF
jgi:hypothetical protein